MEQEEVPVFFHKTPKQTIKHGMCHRPWSPRCLREPTVTLTVFAVMKNSRKNSRNERDAVFLHTAPDERPLKWRWPEPRTARSDCVACVDAHVSKGELLSDLQDMLSCLLDLQIELGLYADDDRLLGKREVQMAC